jgi:C4-dicarboxylate-specific signal transduction histidine kinase
MIEGNSSVSPNLWREAQRSIDRLERARVTGRTLFGIAALGLSVALVLLATLALGANVSRLRDSFGWVGHTNTVLHTISNIQIDLLRAESDIRAYVITADAAYLSDYRGARDSLRAGAARLGGEVADNPAQLARVARLRPLLDLRLSQFDDVVAQGPAAALAQGHDTRRTAARLRLIADIRNRIEDLRNAELALLAQRQAETESRTRGALVIALLAAALAIVAGALGAVVITSERARHRSESLELELMHKQRGVLMDQASSMLAHEINQPLTAASNYLGSAQRLSSGLEIPRLTEAIQKANQQIRRAGEIVRRLRRFIEHQVPEQRFESADVLVADAVALLGTLDGAIQIETVVEPHLPVVFADSVQIQQVLVNLMRNALEAMQGCERRELYLTVRAISADEIDFALRDTGSGLSHDVARKLFRPLTSSKHGGMGVGLAICHTIIAAHGGRIWAEPAVAGGAVFHFTLPVWRSPNEAAA